MSNGLDALLRIVGERRLAAACDTFYFLRHGQTERNALRIFQSVDEPLSALGETQADRAAELLARERLGSIVCSDIRRAMETARRVAARHDLAPQPSEGLRERDFGALIGTSSAAIDWACEPENGETLARFIDRKIIALEDALREPGPVLVVAHGGSLYVLAAALGIEIDRNSLANALPLRFERVGPTWRMTPLLRELEGPAGLA
ncbi:putative phosphoglycerate mutase [Burkholderiales bacterium 8X]|nr:putative phosphoglycerate mutase [Burkholderiales bacterium 8X]